MKRLAFALGIMTALTGLGSAWAQDGEAEAPEAPAPAPWEGRESDPIELQIECQLLYLPGGPDTHSMILQGQQLSYSHASRTLVLIDATEASIGSIQDTPTGESLGAPTTATRGGQSVEVSITQPLGFTVPAEDVPDEFAMPADEWGLSIHLHPVYHEAKGRIHLYTMLQARTPRGGGTEESEAVDQLYFPWFVIPCEPGATSLLLLPPAASAQDEESGSGALLPHGLGLTDPLSDIRYALTVRVQELGAPPPERDDAAYPTFRVGNQWAVHATASTQVSAILEAVKDRTGVGLSLLGDDITPNAVREGEVKVLFQFPGAEPEDELTLHALRLTDLASLFAQGGDPSLPEGLSWRQLQALDDVAKRDMMREALDRLEDELEATQRMITELRAELEAAQARAEGTDSTD
jgi:hypothetical protein